MNIVSWKPSLPILAGVSFCVGLMLTIEMLVFISSADQAEGTVTSEGRETTVSRDTKWRYHAYVTFRDKNNSKHTVRYSEPTTPLVVLLSRGQSVGVLYSADDPAGSARLDFFPILWSWPGLFYLAALGIALLAWKYRQQGVPPPLVRKTVPPKTAPKV